ncbi:sec1 family domain-containing protein 2-like [Antedon mediterranea]|uniref:sec1 family domain-containing protein 2-like n=1 Tax=Antedon mediterranea TaxID=105859 RepID=UPI003AF82E60
MNCLKKSQSASWDALLQHVSEAVVFLDDFSAECLHWSISVDSVFNAGAIAIKDFNAFECGEKGDTKAVFVLSRQLNNDVQDTICDIVEASQFHDCTVICTSKPIVNQQNAGEKTVFKQIQQRIEYYMKYKYARCSVSFLPLIDFSVCSNLFIVPAFSKLFPMFTTDLRKIKGLSSKTGEHSDSDVDVYFEMLPPEMQTEYKLMISYLDDLCERLEINEDIYCIGATSQQIATQLAALPSAKLRRKTASKRASLVVLDRTLDLAGPVSHASETIADKIFEFLTRLKGHTTDVSIDMSMLCSNESNNKRSVLSPGCLAQPEDNTCCDVLNTLIMSKTKESLMEVNRQIVDVIAKEKINPQVSMKMGRGVDLLKSHLELFNVKKFSKAFEQNCGLLQLSVACLQSLQQQQSFDKYKLLEKMILQAKSGSTSPSSCLIDSYKDNAAEKTSEDAEEMLRSLVYLYSLHGTISREDEDELKELLTDYAASNNEQMQSYFDSKRGIDAIFEQLNDIGMAREHLKQFRDIVVDGNDVFPCTYKSFIQHLLEQIVDSSKPELTDLQHRSTGLRDRLKTSFRMFMNVSKPRPSDHPLLIVFVIGGVTCSEVKAVNEISNKSNQEILLGSTSFLKPSDIVDKVFSNNSNNFIL